MAMYTLVSEDYEVEVFTSLNKLVGTLYTSGVKQFDCHDGFQPDENIVARNIREIKTVRAYSDPDSRDWDYKIQIH